MVPWCPISSADCQDDHEGKDVDHAVVQLLRYPLQLLQRGLPFEHEAGAVLEKGEHAAPVRFLPDRVEIGVGPDHLADRIVDHQELEYARSPDISRTAAFLALRLFVFRERATVSAAEERRLEVWMHRQVLRNAIAAGVVFIALSLYAWKYFAPLGPPADTAAPGYLPRPGAQFLWLFQMLKYLPGRVASVVAVALPGLILFGLVMLPFLNPKPLRKVLAQPRRTVGTILFSLSFLLFAVLTFLAYWKDARDPLIKAQLRRQQAEEIAFRSAPFEPLRSRTSESGIAEPQAGKDAGKQSGTQIPGASPSPSAETSPSPNISTNISSAPPESYVLSCSACHGTRGQGAQKFPKLIGVGSKPRRTVEDIIALLNDPTAYGLQPPMRSYANKLTEDEKREIAEWIAGLK